MTFLERIQMLALTRRVGEEIVIGDVLNPLGIIRIVDIHGDKVRLAFDFPREVDINRRELADEKARNGQIRSGSGERGTGNQVGVQAQDAEGQENKEG